VTDTFIHSLNILYAFDRLQLVVAEKITVKKLLSAAPYGESD